MDRKFNCNNLKALCHSSSRKNSNKAKSIIRGMQQRYLRSFQLPQIVAATVIFGLIFTCIGVSGVSTNTKSKSKSQSNPKSNINSTMTSRQPMYNYVYTSIWPSNRCTVLLMAREGCSVHSDCKVCVSLWSPQGSEFIKAEQQNEVYRNYDIIVTL